MAKFILRVPRHRETGDLLSREVPFPFHVFDTHVREFLKDRPNRSKKVQSHNVDPMYHDIKVYIGFRNRCTIGNIYEIMRILMDSSDELPSMYMVSKLRQYVH